MITKEQFCKHIVQAYCKSEGINPKDLSESSILSSSKLAVAMEYLGIIKDQELKEYASTRSGIEIVCVINRTVEILTTRELLGLLPEKEETNEHHN